MNKYIHHIQHPSVMHPKNQKNDMKAKDSLSFDKVLENTQHELKISKHAKERMGARNINIDDATWLTLNNKMKEAKQKGITDAVVVTDDASFIVSTKNNTIITALNKEETTKQIFTNINGTIIL